MPTNVVVPPLGESVTEAVLNRWIKNEGETVAKDEAVVELETDKANVDLVAPVAGVLRHTKSAGDTVHVGEVVARVDEGGAATAAPPKPAAASAAASGAPSNAPTAGPGASGTGAAATTTTVAEKPATNVPGGGGAPAATAPEDLSPAVRRMVEEHHLDASTVPATGPGGRLTKEDVQTFLDARSGAPVPAQEPAPPADPTEPQAPAHPAAPAAPTPSGNGVRRVPMSKIRKRIAERLVAAQHTAAILTTFNEIDLHAMQELRGKFKERFSEVHGVSLGLMSFFARAVVLGLKEFPRVNARIEGEDVIYHDYVNLGIAVSTERGLAVPVLRHVESMSFAKIESEIKRLANATRDGKLSLPELTGSTFTITNGGVFGSLLSTPIINPPESGILGMHTIQKRPVVVNDKIEIRPMMYVALSYDHRLVDGRDSVSFLVRVKQYLEEPSRMMLEV